MMLMPLHCFDVFDYAADFASAIAFAVTLRVALAPVARYGYYFHAIAERRHRCWHAR